MNTIADTSFLYSLYATDANSARADGWCQANPVALPWTVLHSFELRNALSLAVFQGRMTAAQLRAVWQDIQTDLQAGVLVAQPMVMSQVFAEAEKLAVAYTPAIGSRCLDILHVAIARILGTSDFLTFDARQAALGKAVGLNVKP